MANQPKKYKKFVATAATATLVASAIVPVASAASLTDVSGNTHEAAINALVDAGVINGYPNGTFQPNKTLTRSDVVKLLGKFLVSKGHEVPADYKTNVRFNDLSSASNDELLQYAAVVYDAGVFNGSNGNLLAADNITRENMAVVLVRAFDTLNNIDLVSYVQDQDYKKDVKDLYTAKAEARAAIEVLDFFDITSVANFNPKGSTTRGHFATFLFNTMNADFSAVTGVANTSVDEIKAINNTTVEVKFKEAVENIEALDFTIEGLEVKNAVIKQTDAKTVVLTTAAQTGETVYTLNVNASKAGTFKGISAVIPTGISVVEKSIQGVLGQQVTVKAQVTVAEGQSKAGIPVTFNVTSDNNTTLNQAQVFESTTNAEGVATYTYTRYASTNDSVTAYSTGDRTKFSSGKVYWATAQQLTIKDVTGVNNLSNNDSKVYEINSANNANKYVFVTFKENLNVTADKVVRTVGAKGLSTHVLNQNNTVSGVSSEYPYEISTGAKAVIAVKLDSNGKANLVLAGANATVTPVVYEGVAVDGTDVGTIAGDQLNEFTNASYNATAIQAAAPSVSFEAKHVLGLTIAASGVANAATYKSADETGGRDYTVTYVDKDGKPAPANSTVQLAIPNQQASSGVFLIDADGNEVAGTLMGDYRVFTLTVKGNEGKATFTVGSRTVTQYVEPIAFINNGTGIGAKAGLDTTDLQAKGEATHFTDAVNYSTSLTLVDAAGREIKSVFANGTEKAYFEYATVDQNGKPRAYRLANGDLATTTLTYTVQAGTSPVTVTNSTTPGTVRAGDSGTFNLVIPYGATNHALEITSTAPTSATVTATASVAGLVLGTTNAVTAQFTNTSTANVSGTVTEVNKSTNVVSINGVPYALAGATYLNSGTVVPTLAAFYDHLTVGKEVSVTKDADGKLVFNVKGDATSVGNAVLDRVNLAVALRDMAGVVNALNSDSDFAKLSAADKVTVATAIAVNAPFADVTSLQDAIKEEIYNEYITQLEALAGTPGTYANLIALVKKIPGASAAATALEKVTNSDIQGDIITDLATISATDVTEFITEVNTAIATAVAAAGAAAVDAAIDDVEAALAALSSPTPTQAQIDAVVTELRDNASVLGLSLAEFDALSTPVKKNAVITGLKATFANSAVLKQEFNTLVGLAADASAPTVASIELDATGLELIVTFNENIDSSVDITEVVGGTISFLDGNSSGSATVASASILGKVLTISIDTALNGLAVGTTVSAISLTDGSVAVDITDLAIPTANKATLIGLNKSVTEAE